MCERPHQMDDFEPHAFGNYGTYGLTLLGCESIIQYENQIWQFYAFAANEAIYRTLTGESRQCSLCMTTMVGRHSEIQRMQIKQMPVLFS